MSAFHEQTLQYVQQIKAGTNSILVATRVRPLSQKQKKISNFQTVKVLEGKLLSLVEPQSFNPVDVLRKNRSKQIQYSFDFVFDKQVKTSTIYEQTVSILLDGLLEGFNASVLAYGATSCGKTFTMVGQNQNSPGIMAMSVLQLLNRANKSKKYQDIKLKASYVEIYNQNIKDLLISQDKNLDIRQDPNQGVVISGVTEVLVDNISQLKTVLKVGNKNRTMESTGSNQVSSRSHGIFQIRVQVHSKAQSILDETISSKFFLIDLAGSERASNTTNKGLRMVQGAKINQSLLVLGNCIQALSEASQKGLKNAFVPYRGSKLTRLLKDSLGGNCRTVMIAHVAPAVNLFQQTYNTLLYAHRAKNIKNNPIRNTLIVETHLANYVNIINNLKRQNQQLKSNLREKQMNNLSKQKNSPYKYNMTLPVVPSASYNEEIKKFQELIMKISNQENQLSKKVNQIQIKIQQLAFVIYQKQLNKAQEKQVKKSSEEVSDLIRQRQKMQKKFLDKKESRDKIIKQIEKNEILGTNGQTHLKNIIKQMRMQQVKKQLQYKEQLIKFEKKNMDKLIKKIKKSLKNREQIIEKQKLLIKKNNIISRITYSQIDFHQDDDNLSTKSEKKNKSKSKQVKSYHKIFQPKTKRTKNGQKSKKQNGVSIEISQDKQKNSVEKMSNKMNRQYSGKKGDKISQDYTNQFFQQIKINNMQKKSPSKQFALERNLSKKSDVASNAKKILYKSKSNQHAPKFDFVYLPH